MRVVSMFTDQFIDELLGLAREYDKRNNEANRELEYKKDKIRKLAVELGVKVNFV